MQVALQSVDVVDILQATPAFSTGFLEYICLLPDEFIDCARERNNATRIDQMAVADPRQISPAMT